MTSFLYVEYENTLNMVNFKWHSKLRFFQLNAWFYNERITEIFIFRERRFLKQEEYMCI